MSQSISKGDSENYKKEEREEPLEKE